MMVTCCVPSCCTNSRKCEPWISFHEFPTEPEIVSKWIRNINTVVRNGGTWYPRDEDKPYVCSKHFLPTDFESDSETPTLKPRSVPTLFANILGFSSSCMNPPMKRKLYTHSPLIVKINKNPESSDVSAEHNRIQSVEAGPSTETFDHALGGLSGSGQLICNPVNQLNDVCAGPSLLKKMPTVPSNKRHAAFNKKKSDLQLIEIGPNTFLKINPKVIKVAKKVTPSGNSVLQFIMNKSTPVKNTPEIITIDDSEHGDMQVSELCIGRNPCERDGENLLCNNASPSKDEDNVIGHLVDSNFGKELSGAGIEDPADVTEIVIGSESEDKGSNSDIAESDCIQRAPILLTAGVPVSHLSTTPRLMTKLKQKSCELKTLRKKLNRLQSRLESAENRCIVQERELSYAKVKKVKVIRKAAAKGDPAAIYILEQIKAFEGNSVMRWSDSTLRQCSIWCRKAPYAYEYFKKAELFKLPCLSTVKRFMKKCPPDQLQVAHVSKGSQGIDESSSDFNFDSSDDENAEQDKENVAECNGTLAKATNLVSADQNNGTVFPSPSQSNAIINPNDTGIMQNDSVLAQNDQNDSAITSTTSDIINEDSSSNSLAVQPTEIPVSEVQDTQPTSVNVQEVMLPPGIVQCLNSKLGDGQSQYFIIPTLNDQTIMSDHQYSVLQSSNGPLIIQNVPNNQLPLSSQEQLIFITHSTEGAAKSN